MISFTPSIINFPIGKWRNHREIGRQGGLDPPPPFYLHFRKYILRLFIRLKIQNNKLFLKNLKIIIFREWDPCTQTIKVISLMFSMGWPGLENLGCKHTSSLRHFSKSSPQAICIFRPPSLYRVNGIITQSIYSNVSQFITKHKGYSKKLIKHTIQIVSTEDILITLSGSRVSNSKVLISKK